jgi:hypothetical protein
VNFDLLIAIACAVFYYRVGQWEYGRGFAVAGLSVALWLASVPLLGFGRVGALAVQAGLFAGLTVWNAKRRGLR